jgi:CBS domain-containing protein
MKVCDILMKQGCVDDESLEKALKLQGGSARSLEEILVEIGAVKESDVQDALGLQSDLDAEVSSDKRVFLGGIEPFSELGGDALQAIAATMEWRRFDAHQRILKQGEQNDTFYIVKTGLAKITMVRNGVDEIVGFLGEGDFCGATALLAEGVNLSSVEALEDTLCLAQDGRSFSAMTAAHPGFVAFFGKLIVRQSKKVFGKLLTAAAGSSVQVEPFLYSRHVAELLSRNQVFLSPGDTIEDAARRLLDAQVDAAVVVDDACRLVGTIGLRRLVQASLVENSGAATPVGDVAERDYRTVGSDGFFFDALHAMIKAQTDSLVVMTGRRAEGILTSRDLLRFRGREVLTLIRDIEAAEGYDVLNVLRQTVEGVLRTLIADGALASHACEIVSELNDRMARRVIALAEREMGRAPVPYAWLGLGSEGRKEQTLLTDQDNAILFDDPGNNGQRRAVEGYFQVLSERIVHGLDACGFPLCKGNIMATNPKYFGDLKVWKTRTTEWIARNAGEGKDLVDIYTFLDFRVVYGSEPLGETLRSHVINEFGQNSHSLQALAEPIVSVPIPLGFFKHFIVEKNGKYKDMLNMKTHGLLPLTTCVKLLAFERGIGETNTLERMGRLREAGAITRDQAEFTEQAFETFLTFRIRNNLTSLDEGRDFSNNINPSSLTTRQKQLLKDAFLAVSELQKTTKNLLKVTDRDRL